MGGSTWTITVAASRIRGGPISYEEKLIGWALEYNAYNRLAGTGSFPAALREVLLPLIESYREGGVIPQWAGVDLLRAWAFHLVRINRHEDGYLLDEHPEMYAIVAAITKHPAALESDVPPLPEEDDYDVFGAVHARLARLKKGSAETPSTINRRRNVKNQAR